PRWPPPPRRVDMHPRNSPPADALRAGGLILACLALPAALLSCRTPPGPAPPIHADDASAPPPASAAGPRDAAAPFTVPPLGPPAGLILGADFGAECVVEHNVVRWWGTHITKRTANPLTITFPEDVIRLGCGSAHVCVVLASASVQCAGEGNFGQLGIPTSSCAKRPGCCSDMPPAEVPGLPKIVDISVASDTTCVVSEAGEVYCWGPGAWVWMT